MVQQSWLKRHIHCQLYCVFSTANWKSFHHRAACEIEPFQFSTFSVRRYLWSLHIKHDPLIFPAHLDVLISTCDPVHSLSVLAPWCLSPGHLQRRTKHIAIFLGKHENLDDSSTGGVKQSKQGRLWPMALRYCVLAANFLTHFVRVIDGKKLLVKCKKRWNLWYCFTGVINGHYISKSNFKHQ